MDPSESADGRFKVCGEIFTLAPRPARESAAKQRLRRVRKAVETGESIVEAVGCYLTPESRERWHVLAEDRERGLTFLQLREIGAWIADVAGDESFGSRVERACGRVDARHRRALAAERGRTRRPSDRAFAPSQRAPRVDVPVVAGRSRSSQRAPRSRRLQTRRACSPGRSSDDEPDLEVIPLAAEDRELEAALGGRP